MVHDELIRHAKAIKFYRGAVLELGSKLPREDAVLDQLLAELVASKDEIAFTRIILAAVGTGRCVDARHLVEGGCLFSNLGYMIDAAWYCAGNVGEALVSAVKGGLMGLEREANALLIAALWCQDHPEFPMPAELISQARIVARKPSSNSLSRDLLMVLANVMDDEGLKAMLQFYLVPSHPALEKTFLEMYVSDVRRTRLSTVPETPPPVVISGFSVRRAVAKVGRNDPCPCGSGKKYKKCCYDKDRKRLLESSSVPGVTTDELREQPDVGLTAERIAEMRSYELSKIDCLNVPPGLRYDYANKLMAFGMLENVVLALEKWPWDGETIRVYCWAFDDVIEAKNKPLLERLLRLNPDKENISSEDLSVSLVLAEGDGGKQMELIEKAALEVVKSDGFHARMQAMKLAYSLLNFRPSLGIMVARGAIATADPSEAEILLQSLLETRDKLNLFPIDPVCDVVESMLSEPTEEEVEIPEELKEAREHLAAKNLELRKLQKELETLNRDLEKREKSGQTKAAAPVSPPASVKQDAAAPDDSVARSLRIRLESVKALLKERHNERNQLRRELESAREQIERLSVTNGAASEAKSTEEEAEERWLEAEEMAAVQPVRLPEFPRKFQQILASVPASVGRASVSIAGRLGGGDASAFNGVKRLKALRDVYRQRVSKDYRLLFRLHPERVEILDLIHRRDLERTIKAML